jgi:hypothetical protein
MADAWEKWGPSGKKVFGKGGLRSEGKWGFEKGGVGENGVSHPSPSYRIRGIPPLWRWVGRMGSPPHVQCFQWVRWAFVPIPIMAPIIPTPTDQARSQLRLTKETDERPELRNL